MTEFERKIRKFKHPAYKMKCTDAFNKKYAIKRQCLHIINNG